VSLAHNQAHAQGQQGSVRVGLEALSGPFDAIFIVPSDQPLIAAGDLTELIAAFKKRPSGHVVVPMVSG
jgi:CTP:molybdopterin cytidylyltransferase MocA